MTLLPAEALPAPAKEASIAVSFMAVADAIGVPGKAVRFAEGAEKSGQSWMSVNEPALEKEKPATSEMPAGVLGADTTRGSDKRGKQP
jgi:hypothetical protein